MSAAEIETLTDRIDEMKERIDELEGQVEDLEDKLSDAQLTVGNLLDSEEPYRTLVDALKTYLSWQDSPPPGMEAAEVAKLGRILRSQLYDALRSVP
jgi:hypothetical protein